ncbi:MAG: SAM-dependent methyltransferase [bacterium]
MTRGARKLDAALTALAFGEHVRGARAVDVGASTGGFTRTLLDAGAAEVLAVDVGHGQLDPALRRDPRVRVLERVDWKRLPPSIEPGPFDVFTIDVSFTAARTMLRGLAFRLRPGAHGLVLVKPQFELPEGAVEPGAPGDASVRARALERFRAKAERLGFTILGAVDSSVPGGKGTIELFAHLRFDGWQARPGAPAATATTTSAPVEPTRGEAPAIATATRLMRWFAITAPGLEGIAEVEVRGLAGVSDVQANEAGVGFGGTLETGLRANLELRTATRVLARVGTFRAEDFASFRRRVGGLDWSPFLRAEQPLEVQASARRCRLFHTDAVRENVEQGLRDWARKHPPAGAPAAQPLRIAARGSSNRWTLSVDASGELLHRRGWRTEAVRAPLRETLAAALLELCEWRGVTPLVDPMCGAGTLVIEAAALAVRRAPGLERRFACEDWPCFDAALGERLRAELRSRELEVAPVPIVGYDRDPAAVRLARRNAERAGLAASIAFHHGDLASVRATGATGLLIVNPPYGRRLGDPAQARETLRALGQLLTARFRGWNAAVLALDPSWARALGLEPTRTTALRNGGLRVHLLQFAL